MVIHWISENSVPLMCCKTCLSTEDHESLQKKSNGPTFSSEDSKDISIQSSGPAERRTASALSESILLSLYLSFTNSHAIM